MQWMAFGRDGNRWRWSVAAGWRRWVATVMWAALVSGCSRAPVEPPAHSPSSPLDNSSSRSVASSAATSPSAARDSELPEQFSSVRLLQEPVSATSTLLEETWYAVYLEGAKVGHSAQRVYQQDSGGSQPSWLRREMEQQLSLARAGQLVQQTLLLQSLEAADGTVIAFRSVLRDRESQSEMLAQVVDNTIHVVLKTADSSSVQVLPWDPTTLVFFADEQLLRRGPLQPGEKRHAKMFMPVLNLIGDLQLTVRDYETINTRYGPERLIRVESRFVHPHMQSSAVMWCEPDGRMRQYSLLDGKLTAVRTVKEIALAENDVVDLYQLFQLRLANPIPDPHTRRRAVYRIEMPGQGNPERFFVHDHSQHVRLVGPHLVEITVVKITPSEPMLLTSVDPPIPEDTEPNALVQSDHHLIRQLADQVAPADADPWTFVTACEAFVHQYVERKSLDEAFGSAVDVAQSRSGDCTEHAVLLAALCRARGFPARVAAGLVATGDMFAFHLWNEVWVNDRWVPMDATLGRGGIGVGHIKLAVSNLSGISPYSVMAPVLNLLTGMRIDVMRYQ